MHWWPKLTSASRASAPWTLAVSSHVEDSDRLRRHGRQRARDAHELPASLAGAPVELDGLLLL